MSDVVVIPSLHILAPHKCFTLYDVKYNMLGDELFRYDANGVMVEAHVQMLQQIRLTLEVLVAYDNAAHDASKNLSYYAPKVRRAALYHAGRFKRDGRLIYDGREAVSASTFLVNICGRVDYVHYDYLFHLWNGGRLSA